MHSIHASRGKVNPLRVPRGQTRPAYLADRGEGGRGGNLFRLYLISSLARLDDGRLGRVLFNPNSRSSKGTRAAERATRKEKGSERSRNARPLARSLSTVNQIIVGSKSLATPRSFAVATFFWPRRHATGIS